MLSMKEDYYIPVSNDLNPLTAKFFFKKTDFCLHELTLKRDCWWQSVVYHFVANFLLFQNHFKILTV